MLDILGVQVDFDITAPADLLRYDEAGRRMEERAEALEIPDIDFTDPDFLVKVAEGLNAQLKLYGDFIDDVFGDGVANQLLTNNPSMTKVFEVRDAIDAATQAQGKEFGLKLKKYMPDKRKKRKR